MENQEINQNESAQNAIDAFVAALNAIPDDEEEVEEDEFNLDDTTSDDATDSGVEFEENENTDFDIF